ncbi:MAG TPA: hypothetical protein VGN72_06715 [Tepidisphaeraceae bacterium]|jgi:hypothetical protein|nr:hypothetical protein [Tepidisphaeraceae bacterium]
MDNVTPTPAPDAMAEQERQQILYKARHTTPLQRIIWLEETRKLLAPYLLRGEKARANATGGTTAGHTSAPG